jgi:predicted dinucleotide-binding enzyme
MRIGFIGYGSMADALASKWAHGHPLFIGGRNVEKAKALAQRLGRDTGYGSEAEAARFGEVVVLATRHESVFAAMDSAGGPTALAGKVLLDINNPVDVFAGDYIPKRYDGGSLAEAIALYAPQAHVVKAFNMSQATVWKMDPPVFDGRPLVTLYCGDDPGAKRTVATLIADVGCDPEDLGELRYARLLEPAAAIVIKLLFSGRDVHTVLNLIKPEQSP